MTGLMSLFLFGRFLLVPLQGAAFENRCDKYLVVQCLTARLQPCLPMPV